MKKYEIITKMKFITILWDGYDYTKQRLILVLWISLVIYLFYSTFTFYESARQFYHLRKILGFGLCISRGTATVINLCSSLVLLPMCKKINHVWYRLLAKAWPGLLFFWLERVKSFHMNVAVTMLIFSVMHSISHLFNLWNYSRNYDDVVGGVNFASYKNQNPLILLMSIAGLTGVTMLLITMSMGLTSMRFIRRKMYNVFWYTHQLYLPFLILLVLHPMSGVIKQEVIVGDSSVPHNSTISHNPQFEPIKSTTWMWMIVPLSCFTIDLVWRILSRNFAKVNILEVKQMPGRTISLTLSSPHEAFHCKNGQYILLQCLEVSLLEWHPFTVVYIPTTSQTHFVLWIRVKGDWTESLESLLINKGSLNLNVFADGPFASPMENISNSEVAICVAAGVGITPFVSTIESILMNPRGLKPGRIHLLWIVKEDKEIMWLAELLNRTILDLRSANRLDRLQVEFYVTNSNENLNDELDKPLQSCMTHVVTVNDNGKIYHSIGFNLKDRLLMPKKENTFNDLCLYDKLSKCNLVLSKDYPIIGCRIRRGRPNWDRAFGYWVHLYPRDNVNLFCCGPKKLVKELKSRCLQTSRSSRTKFTFIHEGFP